MKTEYRQGLFYAFFFLDFLKFFHKHITDRENMILENENRTLKEKLQKAYDFMKQFTINGLNMLESFLESIGERMQKFSENIGFGGGSR